MSTMKAITNDLQWQYESAQRLDHGELVPIVAALLTAVPGARPDRRWDYEPGQGPWSDRTIADYLGDDAHGGGEMNSPAGHVWVVKPGDNFLPRALCHLVGPSRGADTAALVDLLVDCTRASGAWYGHLHLLSDRDRGIPHEGSLDGGDESIGVGQVTVRNHLPELWWGTVYGPELSSRFGRDRIAHAPAHRVEELAPDTWWVQVTEHLDDLRDNWDAFNARRQEVKAALGLDRYWSPSGH